MEMEKKEMEKKENSINIFSSNDSLSSFPLPLFTYLSYEELVAVSLTCKANSVNIVEIMNNTKKDLKKKYHFEEWKNVIEKEGYSNVSCELIKFSCFDSCKRSFKKTTQFNINSLFDKVICHFSTSDSMKKILNDVKEENQIVHTALLLRMLCMFNRKKLVPNQCIQVMDLFISFKDKQDMFTLMANIFGEFQHNDYSCLETFLSCWKMVSFEKKKNKLRFSNKNETLKYDLWNSAFYVAIETNDKNLLTLLLEKEEKQHGICFLDSIYQKLTGNKNVMIENCIHSEIYEKFLIFY